MDSGQKLNAKQVELLLKLQLMQKKEILARIKKIEEMPDSIDIDKVAMMREALNLTEESK